MGLVSLMSALYGLSATWARGGRMLRMHLLVLALLVIAWAAEHTTVVGWAALGIGAALELVDWWLWLFSRRVRGGAMSPVPARTAAAPAKPARVASVGARASTVEAATAHAVRETATPLSPDLEARGGDVESVCPERDDPGLPERALPRPERALERPLSITASSDDEGPAHSYGETEPAAPEVGDFGASATNDTRVAEEPALSGNDDPTDVAAAAPAEVPADVLPELPSISTVMLLRTSYDVSPGVFYASLRRSGQRDALLVEAPEATGETRIQVGPITLRLRTEVGPCDPTALEASLAATTDWPEAAETTVDHEAHVVLTSEYVEETPRDVVIRLLHRAHAALAEFAPVIAVLWVGAERLVRADELPSLLARAADTSSPIAETCVQFRLFALSEANDGLFLSDCVGLHALGLPDIQFITKGEPPETVIQTLRGLAERFLTTGCDVADGSTFDMADGETWRATHTRGAFPPDREVIQITVRR